MQTCVDWVLKNFGTQVIKKKRPDRPVFPDCLSVSYDYDFNNEFKPFSLGPTIRREQFTISMKDRTLMEGLIADFVKFSCVTTKFLFWGEILGTRLCLYSTSGDNNLVPFHLW